MNESTHAVVVMITAGGSEEANLIAQMLVGDKLAACVQLLPEMKSIYMWRGEVQNDSEILILAKTTREKFVDLEQKVRAIHSYETPEIIALGIEAASEPYLKWLTNCLDGS